MGPHVKGACGNPSIAKPAAPCYPLFMSAPAESFSRARQIELILLFGILTVFTPIGIDMYLPALPAIAAEFHSPIAAIEHSLAAFFLGLCLGQAAIGPLSDRFGRRQPIIIGLGLYVLGAAGCALATGPPSLDAARFIQAVGGCAGTVLARACVRDLFPAPSRRAHLRPDAADPVSVALVRALCRRLAAALDRLARHLLGGRRIGGADHVPGGGTIAGKPSRLGPAGCTHCMWRRTIGPSRGTAISTATSFRRC